MVEQLLTAILLIAKIFLSLNAQDVPAFFEEHHTEFFSLFHKYLTYDNSLLRSQSDEEAGPLEKLRSSICEIVALYADRYEDDFKMMPEFVPTVWQLLISVGREPKSDVLVYTAIGVLASVAKHTRNAYLFQDSETLKSICERIIIPNMELRALEEELFEDNAIEYIRRDMEGGG